MSATATSTNKRVELCWLPSSGHPKHQRYHLPVRDGFTPRMARPQANGHAKSGRRRMSVSEAIEKIDETLQQQENIFLFVPNLIGASESY